MYIHVVGTHYASHHLVYYFTFRISRMARTMAPSFEILTAYIQYLHVSLHENQRIFGHF